MPEKASKANNFHYNKNLKHLARELRNNSTKAEIYLWDDILKQGLLKGYQFLRQRPVLEYIADFMCPDLMLIIEVDGMTHEFEKTLVKDGIKQSMLEEAGFTVLRYSDWEVMEKRDELAQELLDWIDRFEREKQG
jgi:very-short-patch-repair endonuclease